MSPPQHIGSKRSADSIASTSGIDQITGGNNTNKHNITSTRKTSRFTDAVISNTSTSTPMSLLTTTSTTAPVQSLADKARAVKERVEALKRAKTDNNNNKQHTPVNVQSTINTTSARSISLQSNSSSRTPQNPYLPTTVDTIRSRPLSLYTQPGRHTAAAVAMRMKQLQHSIQQKQQSDTSLIISAPSTVLSYYQSQYNTIDSIPQCEWWDTILLNDADNGYIDSNMNDSRVTSHIYHPISLVVVGEPPPPPPQPVPMTRKEHRKLKKHLRQSAVQEKRDRIKLGLDAPVASKLKVRNLHNTLLMDSVADPTALEYMIKQQVADRKQKHIDDNKARQLTAEQKKQKFINKYTEDTSIYTTVHVYRIPPFNSNKIKFQLSINAQQYRLTGICIRFAGDDNENNHTNTTTTTTATSHHCIIVEGGPRAMKRFHRLLTHRIQWISTNDNNDTVHHQVNDSDISDDDDSSAGISSAVQLVWSGSVSKPSFIKFTIEQCRNEYSARKLLERYNVEHYYQMVKNYQIT